MFKHLFQSVDIMTILGVVALLFFFLSFLLILFYTFKIDKKYSDEMSNKPLEKNNLSTTK